MILHQSWPPVGTSFKVQSISMQQPSMTVNGTAYDSVIWWTVRAANLETIEVARFHRKQVLGLYNLSPEQVRIVKIQAEVVE